MRASLISIGDELLIGQVINTNAAKIGEHLNLAGIKVEYCCAVPDDRVSILDALSYTGGKSEIVIITGGLGPTKDDITKKVLCEFFNSELRVDEEVLADVKEIFERRGKKLSELNRKQAEVPDKCLVIRNAHGTAPGMWFNSDGKIYISIPGVPYEALAMIENFILPKLKAENVLPAIFHYTVHTQGIGESFLAEIIEEWENSLSVENVKLAYLPSPGMVRLRLSGFGDELELVKHNVMKKKEELIPLISEYIYGYEEYGSPPPKIQKLLGDLLIKNGKKIALAESCTGGYISHLITSIPGSSEYFNGGIIPYHNEFKNELLEVDEDVFRLSGAVSEECVKSMAKGIIKKYRSDYSIAVSGIAGPSGGTPEKPVGTVWIAWSNTKETIAEKFIFTNDRERNIHLAAINAMEKMRRMIEKGF